MVHVMSVTSNFVSYWFQQLQFPAFGKEGHGAPMRTDSGSLKTSMRANHDIRFQAGGKNMPLNVHNKIRYTQPKQKGVEYINDLGK